MLVWPWEVAWELASAPGLVGQSAKVVESWLLLAGQLNAVDPASGLVQA